MGTSIERTRFDLQTWLILFFAQESFLLHNGQFGAHFCSPQDPVTCTNVN